MRSLPILIAFAAASLAGAASAAPCRDAAGKFIKCPAPVVATAAPAHCQDAKTKKFAKCGTPGAVAMVAKPAMSNMAAKPMAPAPMAAKPMAAKPMAAKPMAAAK